MTKKLASTYFAEVKADRDIYGGYYSIPAVPKGAAPAILIVEDKVQSWQMSEMFKRQVRRDLIAGEEIADDILKQWTENAVGMTTACHPGIWIVRDSIAITKADGSQELDQMGRPTFRSATAEEKAAMWDEDLAAAKTADANWAEYLIQKGDMMADDPRQVQFIPQLCKLAARHYGRDREWLHALKDSDVKTCQYCTKMVSSAAVKCPFCQEVIDFVKYAELERKKQAVLKSAQTVTPPITVPKVEARA